MFVNRFWKWAGFALLIGFLVTLLLGVFGNVTIGPQQDAKMLGRAKQMALAVKLYAEDHHGSFPMSLGELTPEFVTPDGVPSLQFEVRDEYNDPLLAKQDWLYFGAFFDESDPPPIIIASPQTTGFKGKPPKRIVIAGDMDMTGYVVKEAQYQDLLRKTIEAMHQRAGTLTTPATESSPASPDAAAAPANPRTPAVPDKKPNIR